MGKHNSTLKENIVITPPKAPKSFGNWLGLFEFAFKNKIYPDKDVMLFIDDEGTKQYIKFTLLCQYVMQETAANFGKVTKLCDDLTAENTRILEHLDVSNGLVDDLRLELTSIKSKWWYKLFTWKW